MILATVKATIVSTRKMQSMVGFKLLLVEPVYSQKEEYLVAGDTLGAGIGEMVLVTTDTMAQYALEHQAPIDAVVVGIVDHPPTLGK